jgi:hypothetical protein
MSINSRLRNLERSLKGRELALRWLKSSQARGGYSEYWEIGEFQPWASENEEAGLLYHLASHSICSAHLSASPTWRPVLTGSKAPGDSWTSSSPVRGQSSRRETRTSYAVAGLQASKTSPVL